PPASCSSMDGGRGGASGNGSDGTTAAGDGSVYGMVAQICWVQKPPSGVQMPQLALQHTWPAGHTVLPQVAHAIWLHASPGRVHTPQLALQHTSSPRQV